MADLKEIGIESIYHNFYNEQQGSETIPTLYFQKNAKKFYHIDYIFTPKNIKYNIERFEIGQPKDWILLSDHMPILCEIKITE